MELIFPNSTPRTDASARNLVSKHCLQSEVCTNSLGPAGAVGLIVLLFFASPAPAAWIDMGVVSQNTVSLLIDTAPSPGGALTVVFNIGDPAQLTGKSGSPDLNFQLGFQRPAAGGATKTASIVATLANPNLTGPENIPFSEIAWTSTGLPGGALQPTGTILIGGSNVPLGTGTMYQLTTTAAGTYYAGGVLHFTFTPSRLYVQGGYSGTVTFTASHD